MSRPEARKRIRAQWPLTRKKRLADFAIDNGGSRAGVEKQVRALIFELKKNA